MVHIMKTIDMEPRGPLVIEKCHMCVHKIYDGTCKIFRNPYNAWKRENGCNEYFRKVDIPLMENYD